MAKHANSIPFAAVSVDDASDSPLYRQLYENLRQAILNGQIAPGTRLPSTREIASELRLSRNTVMNAFEQLLAEGYVEGHVGSGTYVSQAIPDELLTARSSFSRTIRSRRKGRTVSKRGELLATTPIRAECPALGSIVPFRTGVPALDVFPFDVWQKIVARHWRRPKRELLSYGEPEGYKPLREAVASYLGAARAVRCAPEQVIVVAGTQQAVDLIARTLLDPGDKALLEDYGYLAARGALKAAEARLIPVPVDEEGFDVGFASRKGSSARLAYVSPSHEYPLGVTLSLSRRLALLEWASRNDAYIIEDDYDSEFRYSGRPLAAMQGLDEEGRVIYLGTFSKVLFPSLRLGYMVVPEDLIDAFASARALVGWCSPVVDQAVVAEFITEGHFARHIRRMRSLYAERQAALVEAAREEMEGLLDVEPAAAGLHLLGWLPEGSDDRQASRACIERGVQTQPLSAFALGEHYRRGGLILGYAPFNERETRAAVRVLSEALRGVQRAGRRKAS